MKKLMRKLVLSSFALGLAVITLSTTTFAWYTSNTTVTADGVQSTTSAAGADLLMITQYKLDENKLETSELQTWGTSIPAVHMSKKDNLSPRQLVSNNMCDYNKKGESAVVVDSGYLEFTLCFKNAGNSAVDLFVEKFQILNITKATKTDGVWGAPTLPTKDVITAGSTNGMPGYTGASYQVDVLQTLMVHTTVTTYTMTESGLSGTSTNQIYDPEGIVTIHETDDFVTGWNAHKYYNGIMCQSDTHSTDSVTVEGCKCLSSEAENTYESDKILPANTDVTGATKLVLASIPKAGSEDTKDQYVAIRFRVFINGWDFACFDACQEQEIAINLEFTSDEASKTVLKVLKYSA